MARTLLVVDNLSDWAPYYPSGQLITFELSRDRVD